LAVTSHGKLVSGGGIDGALLLWNPSAPGEPAREITRHDGVVLAASVAQDGLVAYGGLDGVIQLLQTSVAALHSRGLRSAKGFEARLPGLSPDEEYLLKLL